MIFSPETLQHLPHYVYWCVLAVAVAFELMGTTFIREAKGFAYPAAALKACICYSICTALCIVAFAAHIDLSVGYTVWCVLGIAATALIGRYRFGEQFTLLKVLALLLCALGSMLLVFQSEKPLFTTSAMNSTVERSMAGVGNGAPETCSGPGKVDVATLP
jgi:small multidrug resistance pump